ncbi:MAG: cytochrome C biogenesis protein [Bacteroidota bacterium]
MNSAPDYKIEIFIPERFVPALREELARAGAGRIGNYDHCIAYSLIHGSWRPLEGSNPYDGEIGKISEGTEAKVEVNCPADRVRAVLQAIRRVHPYEEPLINLIPLANHLYLDGESNHE